MNGRQRLFMALEGREPDSVPIAPIIGWYGSVVLGIGLDDLSRTSMLLHEIPCKGYVPRWKVDLESCKKLGVDVLTFVRSWLFVAKETTRESFKVSNHPKGTLVRKTYDTPKGALTEELLCYSGKVGVETRKYVITNPEEDFEKIEYVLGDPTRLDFQEYERARYQVGEHGVVGVNCNSPMSFWLTMRGMKEGLLDFYRQREIVDKYMKMYGKWVVDFAKTCGEYQVDLLWMRGTYDGCTIISPDDWKRYIREPLTNAFKEAGKSLYFLEGRCAKLLDLVKETGVTCLEPLEPPPQGDCDLAEVKSKIGRDVALKGNITPSELELASPSHVEKMVIDRIKAGGGNGGYILSTSDQITQRTPMENVVALVRTAKKYGKYPLSIP